MVKISPSSVVSFILAGALASASAKCLAIEAGCEGALAPAAGSEQLQGDQGRSLESALQLGADDLSAAGEAGDTIVHVPVRSGDSEDAIVVELSIEEETAPSAAAKDAAEAPLGSPETALLETAPYVFNADDYDATIYEPSLEHSLAEEEAKGADGSPEHRDSDESTGAAGASPSEPPSPIEMAALVRLEATTTTASVPITTTILPTPIPAPTNTAEVTVTPRPTVTATGAPSTSHPSPIVGAINSQASCDTPSSTFYCASNTQFARCIHGRWVLQSCAPGTACRNGACGFP